MLPVITTSLLFLGSLALIFSEKLNRTIVAFASAALMLIIGKSFGFYSEELAIEAIDFNTLGLLLGMMILVSLLEPTGFFEFLAVWVARLSHGNPVRLLILLGTVTTVVSMFLDNVTTVVLIAPVTILICEILGISSQPLLMAEALLSNTGGVATLVGDPPNVLIASAAGFSFNDFLIHSLPVVLITWLSVLMLLRYLFRSQLHEDTSANPQAVLSLSPQEALKDRKSIVRVLIVIALSILAFLFEEKLHMQPSMVALTAAALALVLVQPPISETLKRVEWDVLVFFGALFVMVGGMEAAGVMHLLSGIVLKVGSLPPVILGLLILWIVAFLSAIVDNIPITIALIPVILELESAGIDVNPLWWALAFGAGFGGNGTIIGSTANVVVTTLSERTRHPITPAGWSRLGLPVMLVACLVASVLYVFISFTFGWGGG